MLYILAFFSVLRYFFIVWFDVSVIRAALQRVRSGVGTIFSLYE